MKTCFLFLSAIFFSFIVNAQLHTTPKCPDFNIDILKGSVNGIIFPNATVDQIKANLPCFTSFQEEADSSKCGGGVYYKDKDVSFYTRRDYVEIGPGFKGKLSLPLMHASRNSLFQWLGAPQMKDKNWDAFQTSYGILILYYDPTDKVNKIQFSTEKANTIRLCE
ncbi:MAG: hypothetical protein ACTHK0_13840 [Ginsengibacter sp.]